MNILVISIKEVTMTENQVNYRVLLPGVLGLGIPTENVEYVASVVVTCRDLTVAVVCRFSSWPRKDFGLVSFGEVN